MSFEEFWDNWPRKVAKLAAQRAYNRALRKKGVTPARLLRAAKLYASEPRDLRYTLHAASFLNGERYEEYVGYLVDAATNPGEAERTRWEYRIQMFQRSGYWSGRWGRPPWGAREDDPRPIEAPMDLVEKYRPKEKGAEAFAAAPNGVRGNLTPESLSRDLGIADRSPQVNRQNGSSCARLVT